MVEKKISNKRSRNFSIVTYLTKEQMQSVLNAHSNQIRAFAFIEHNCDIDENGLPKERHIHCIIKTFHQSTTSGICSWFRGFTDSKNMPVNTLAQIVFDISGCFEYLTHNTEVAIAEGKYLYSDDEVITNNAELFKNTAFEEDNLSLALDDMLNGIPLVDIAKKYGRDFIIHYGHIRTLFNDIQTLIGGKTLS